MGFWLLQKRVINGGMISLPGGDLSSSQAGGDCGSSGGRAKRLSNTVTVTREALAQLMKSIVLKGAVDRITRHPVPEMFCNRVALPK